MMASLMNKASNGSRKDMFLSFMINPENNAMAMNGEKPDHSNLGANKSLQMVCSATSTKVKMISLLLIFMSVKIKAQK